MRMLLFALSLISAAVLLAACGKEEERAPAARETPAVTTTSGPTATSAAAPAAASLRNLSSYRYSLKMELEGLESPWAQSMGSLAGETPGAIPETLELEVSGAFVAPDKAEARVRFAGLEGDMATTIIGNQQWVKLGDLAMGPTEFTGDISEADLASLMWEEFSAGVGDLTCTSEKKETVNGVPSRYCGIDKASVEQLASLFGGGEEMDKISELNLQMWLAEDDGWPVRLRVRVAGTDETGQKAAATLDMDITDVNEKIEIKPPG